MGQQNIFVFVPPSRHRRSVLKANCTYATDTKATTGATSHLGPPRRALVDGTKAWWCGIVRWEVVPYYGYYYHIGYHRIP